MSAIPGRAACSSSRIDSVETALTARAEEKGDLAASMKDANKGYKAVSATASVKDGRPVAEIVLLKGARSRTVSQPLE